jgi:hypothetical protein
MESQARPSRFQRQHLYASVRTFLTDRSKQSDFRYSAAVVKMWDRMCEFLEHPGRFDGGLELKNFLDIIPSADEDDETVYIRVTKSRLKEKLNTFFTTSVGKAEAWSVCLDRGDYVPRFIPSTSLIALFWEPHIHGSLPTQLYYPEPFFMADDENTVIRNRKVNSIADLEKSTLFDQERRRTLRQTYSYVPSGIVRAMCKIMTELRDQLQDIECLPFPPNASLPSRKSLIVVGAASSMDAVAPLESGLRIQTTINDAGVEAIRIDGEDFIEEKSTRSKQTVLKRGVLTRRSFMGGTATVISAHHGNVVDAITNFVGDPAKLMQLHSALKSSSFPEMFQASFEVQVSTVSSNQQAFEATLHRVRVPKRSNTLPTVDE